MKKRLFSTIFLIILMFGLSTSSGVWTAQAADGVVYDHFTYLPILMRPANSICRYGITYRPVTGILPNAEQLKNLRVGAFLDWGMTNKYTLGGGVEYIHVVAVGGDLTLFSDLVDTMAGRVRASPGDYWIVGNEPDTSYFDQGGSQQDNLLPEVYAERFYQVATVIRQTDLNAKIGFGSLVQPTPIRLRYLERAWNYLMARAGTQQAASSLIDFWTTHNFILNEQSCAVDPNNCWGTGIPPGFESDQADKIVITNLADTYSNAIFEQRIRNFRQWLKDRGQQSKALWITEYGSLLPPVDQSPCPSGDPKDCDFANVSDQTTANFMVGTFNFMRTTADPNLGMPGDKNLLVQRWFWYSLSDLRYTFGGSLFDPEYALAPTTVGNAFLNYTQSLPAEPVCNP